MNPEQLRMMQQMRMMQEMQGVPQMPKPQRQGGGKPQQAPWYDRFGWWTVFLMIVVGGLVAMLLLPPLK